MLVKKNITMWWCQREEHEWKRGVRWEIKKAEKRGHAEWSEDCRVMHPPTHSWPFSFGFTIPISTLPVTLPNAKWTHQLHSLLCSMIFLDWILFSLIMILSSLQPLCWLKKNYSNHYTLMFYFKSQSTVRDSAHYRDPFWIYDQSPSSSMIPGQTITHIINSPKLI